MCVGLIYETHSITTDNERGIATGWLPGELSEAGRKAARELARRRHYSGLDVVYTSDLDRAVQTADIAFSGCSIPVIRDHRLRECNYGDWNGMPVERLHAERGRRITQPFPGGESYQQVVERTRSFLSDLTAMHDHQLVLVIAHSANRWALDYLLNDLPLEQSVTEPFEWKPGWEYTACPESAPAPA